MAAVNICENRSARFNFELFKTVTAGIALKGSEVKAIREGRIRLDESYAQIINGEVWIHNLYIGEYSHGGLLGHEPTRKRKLLLHKQEIRRLQAGVTLDAQLIQRSQAHLESTNGQAHRVHGWICSQLVELKGVRADG